MADYYLDNRSTGTNAGTVANPYKSISDFVYAAFLGNNDTVNFVAGSGPYRESFSAAINSKNTPFLASATIAGAVLTRAGSLFITTYGFAANDYVRIIEGDQDDGIYRIASLTEDAITFTTAIVGSASPARIRISTFTNAYLFRGNGADATPILHNFNSCIVSGGLLINTTKYTWRLSALGTNEYYLTKSNNTNPFFVTAGMIVAASNFGSMSIDGDHRNYSASDADLVARTLGTVGSLVNLQWGVGDNDSLGYITIYVRDNEGMLASRAIEISATLYGHDSNWQYSRFIRGDIRYSYSSGIRARGIGTRILRTKFAHQGAHAIDNNACAGLIIESCEGFWTGHRFFTATGNFETSIYNCTDYGAHLFILIDAAVTSACIVNIANNISANGEAGAIDKKSAAAVLNNFGGNCWYPRMTAAGGALGYVSTANWTITAPTDYPPSAATTIATQANIIAAGGVNPTFIDPTNNTVPNLDLSQSSVLFKKGVSGYGYQYTDVKGAVYSSVNPNIGCYSTRKTHTTRTAR